MKEISIIIPVYKVEDYLSKCLESIIKYKGEDIEIICVYDGEDEDNSVEILSDFAKLDNRIMLYKGRNKGLSGARNDGLQLSTGKLIWFVDADDYIKENAIERIKKEYQKNEFDILVIGTDITPKEGKIPEFITDSLYTRNARYYNNSRVALFKECGAKPFVWRNIYNKRFLLSTGINFDEDNLVGEDMSFQLMIFPKAKRIVFIKEKLYCYLWKRSGSLRDIYDINKKKQLDGHVKLVSHVYKRWLNENYSNDYWLNLYCWAIDFLSEEIPYTYDDNLIYEAKEILESIQREIDEKNMAKIGCFYNKLLQSFDNPMLVRRNSIIFSIKHCYYSRGMIQMMLLILNRIKEIKK